jgi:hypothetical protein
MDTSHVWTCRDAGSGNGRGRLSSLWFFVTSSLVITYNLKKIISQEKKKKKKEENIQGSADAS